MTDAPPYAVPELRTTRLRLRGWRESDREPFAAQNADAETMRFLGGVLTRGESDAYFDRAIGNWAEDGCGKWILEEATTGAFVGALGLQRPRFEADFTPAVEIAWRLARAHWGRGYATEAARAAVAWGFETLNLSEIIAMTVPDNWPSRRVMERLGMRLAGAFDHPLLAPENPLRPHVLYRLAR